MIQGIYIMIVLYLMKNNQSIAVFHGIFIKQMACFVFSNWSDSLLRSKTIFHLTFQSISHVEKQNHDYFYSIHFFLM